MRTLKEFLSENSNKNFLNEVKNNEQKISQAMGSLCLTFYFNRDKQKNNTPTLFGTISNYIYEFFNNGNSPKFKINDHIITNSVLEIVFTTDAKITDNVIKEIRKEIDSKFSSKYTQFDCYTI